MSFKRRRRQSNQPHHLRHLFSNLPTIHPRHPIKTQDLTVGDLVSVSWKPNRHCTFRYLGDYRFIVEQAENSKLKVGNTFRCALFILGEPLYLSDLVQGNEPPVAFVVGNKDGLCELEKK